jgi:hypothetical protein
MKRLLPIFELTKNEQRIVLIVTLVLVAISFVGYERSVHRRPVAADSAPSPTPVEAGR